VLGDLTDQRACRAWCKDGCLGGVDVGKAREVGMLLAQCREHRGRVAFVIGKNHALLTGPSWTIASLTRGI
jgi:hypothetical protein